MATATRDGPWVATGWVHEPASAMSPARVSSAAADDPALTHPTATSSPLRAPTITAPSPVSAG